MVKSQNFMMWQLRGALPSDYLTEAVDLHVLEKYAAPHYQPSDEPLVMDVGVLGGDYAAMFRAFHQRKFGIAPGAVRAIACNLKGVLSAHPPPGYDFVAAGTDSGDARLQSTWARPFLGTGIEQRKYDLVYIRNPDLTDFKQWVQVFKRSLWNLTEPGVLVAVIKADDMDYFEGFQQSLAREHGISPIDVIVETG